MVGTQRLVSGTTPRATVPDTLRVADTLVLPLVARGVIVRRPHVVDAAEKLDADARAVRLLQRLRDRYGDGPLQLSVPGRSVALVLSPDDVHRVLEESPEPFSPAAREKRAALAHFQPRGSLISEGRQREERRAVNDRVLEGDRPVHDHAERMLAVIREEAAAVLAGAERSGQLSFDDFVQRWYRVVRRIVLGDGAADDVPFTELLGQLRSEGNWSFMRRAGSRRRDDFLDRLRGYVERAEPGSLAQLVATDPSPDRESRVQQIPQWLFAFDPAGMAAFRTLALLAAHPVQHRRALDELAVRDLSVPQDLPYLRACVLESLRLWPTTPAVLRETTAVTHWDTGSLEADTLVLVYAPFFHRDDQRLEEAHRLAPELWAGGRSGQDWPLIPFSGGPGECPGRNVVLLTTSTMLAWLLPGHEWQMDRSERLDPAEPLPGTFSPHSTSFRLAG